MNKIAQYIHTHCIPGTPGGWERSKRMAELLGNPQEKLNIIHVAGTNGKGSVCAMLESVLRQAGYTVGLYTSPHLEDYRERIQINRQLIPEDDFYECLTLLIEEVIPQILAEGHAHPTEFEIWTMTAFMYFAGKTDIVILEVGLGGELDPTNIITKPLLSVITPISIDHSQVLGSSLTEIATAKAGIIKAGGQVISAWQEDEARKVIEEKSWQIGAESKILTKENIPFYQVALLGAYQQENCHLAVQALEWLREQGKIKFTPEDLAQGLAQVKWQGRLEYIALSKEKEIGILLDGAHNPAGINALCHELSTTWQKRNIILLLGILDDKEQLTMAEKIIPLAQKVIITCPDTGERGVHWQRVADYAAKLCPNGKVEIISEPENALRHGIAGLQSGDLFCITGSLHLLGDCRSILKQLFLADKQHIL